MSASDMFAQEIAAKVIAALRDEVPVRDLVSIRGAAQFLDCSVQQVRNFMEAWCDFDELHQVAQIAAWRAPERYKGVAAKSAVIDHILRNTGRRRVCTELPAWAIRPDFQKPENIEARVVSQRAMRILPVRLYWIVYAKFWLGMKQVEIARAIGANEARVHQLLSDAMDRMRMEVAA